MAKRLSKPEDHSDVGDGGLWVTTWSDDPTKQLVDAMRKAFDVMNHELFGKRLPRVILSAHRDPRPSKGGTTFGYFWPRQWKGRGHEGKTHELALCPNAFQGVADKDILATLVHEMCHLEQEVHGKAPAKCYHNKQWGAMMDAVGLTPSASGEPGGKRTGRSMHHIVVAGGPFDRAADKLIASGWKIDWQVNPDLMAVSPKKKTGKRSSFCCPDCEAKASAKIGAILRCGSCESYPLMDETLPEGYEPEGGENSEDEDE